MIVVCPVYVLSAVSTIVPVPALIMPALPPLPPLAERGPKPKPVPPPAAGEIERSIGRGVAFLLKRQNRDGSWGSASDGGRDSSVRHDSTWWDVGHAGQHPGGERVLPLAVRSQSSLRRHR